MTNIKLICPQCNKEFEVKKKKFNYNNRHNYKSFCSIKCGYTNRDKRQKVICLNCKKIFLKRLNEIKKTPNHFCNRRCAAIYNNKHKKFGTRVSKLEVFLQEKFNKDFNDLQPIYNSKEEIGSELDFYFPSLKLAIEINGIYHYEPIHGKDKLTQIQNNDKAKLRACDEKDIDLIIISTMEAFSLKKADIIYENLRNIILNRKNLTRV